MYGSVSSDLHQGLCGTESLEPGSGCLRLCGPHGLLPEVEGTETVHPQEFMLCAHKT